MTDKQLEYIMSIATEGSVSRAAEKLYVSQSALSQTLARVEEELGVELFSRTSQPLLPTYAGELFLAAATQILNIRKNLLSHYEEVKNETAGRIHVGMSQDRSWLFTPIMLPPFMERYPGVDIVFTEGAQAEMDRQLLNGSLDLIITAHPHLHQSLSYYRLFSEQMLLLLPINPSFACHAAPPSGISQCGSVPFILTKQGNHLRTLSDAILYDAKISPRVILESNSMDVCLRTAARGLGATIVPDTLYYLHECRDQVRAIPLAPKYDRDIALAYRKEMYLPFILREFIRIASESLLFVRAQHTSLQKNAAYPSEIF